MRDRLYCSSRIRTSAALGIVLVAGLTLPPGSGTGLASQQAPEGYPAAGEPTVVKLISSGAEPRRELRYRPAQGVAGRMNMRMEMAMTMAMDGMSMPAVPMPVMTTSWATEITEVTDAGDFSFRLSLVEADVESAPGVDPNLLSMLRTSFQSGLKGFSGTGTVSNRGVQRAFALDSSGVADPQMRQTLSSMTSSLEQLAVPLPEEPIGVGASWEIYQRLEQGGLVVFQKGVQTVKSIDGDVVTLETTISQQAPRQAASDMGLPPGVEVFLRRMTGSGTGTATVDLTSLMPAGSASTESAMELEMSMGGSTQTMSMGSTIKMSIVPVR